jgi:hypothetical protein
MASESAIEEQEEEKEKEKVKQDGSRVSKRENGTVLSCLTLLLGILVSELVWK